MQSEDLPSQPDLRDRQNDQDHATAISRLFPRPKDKHSMPVMFLYCVITSIILAILTPPSSCSEDTPSVNFEFEQSEKQAQKSRGSQAPKAVKGKPKSDKPPLLVKGTCSICDDYDTNLLLCKGQCYRTFHLDCLGLMQLPDFRFVYDECLTSRNECFVCKKSDGELHSCNKPNAQRSTTSAI